MAVDAEYIRALRRCYFQAMSESQPFLQADPQHQSLVAHIRRNNTHLFMSGVMGMPGIYFFHTRLLKQVSSPFTKWGVTGVMSLGLLAVGVKLLSSEQASEDLTKLAWGVEKELRGLCKDLAQFEERKSASQ